MTWTFDNTNPDTDLNRVRTNIGDTLDRTADNQSVTDEQINMRLADASSVDLASVRALEDLIALYTQVVNRSAAGVNSSQGQKLTNMKDLLKILRSRAGKGRSRCYAGGISQDRIDSAAAATDYPPSAFSVGQDDKP